MDIKKLLGFAKVVGEDVLKVVEAGAPAAAGVFGGPGAGGLVQAVIAEVHGMAANGVAPNKELLTTSIGQIITGVIGLLQATGKIPNLDQTVSAIIPLPKVAFPSTKA